MKSSIRMLKRHSVTLALSMVFAVSCQNKGSSYGSGNPFGEGPMAVNIGASDIPDSDLGAAGGYVILAKAGITNTGTSAIVGNMGVSPITYASMTGFGLNPIVPSASTVFATSAQVNGKAYAADYNSPTPSNLTTAIGSMETAYTDAAGRKNPDYTELAAGNLGGRTLTPGLYKWGTAVGMTSTVYISGSSTDTWIFQIAQGLTMSDGISIVLLGDAQPKNIFWQVAGAVQFNAGSHFEGILLAAQGVTLITGASMNGRIFSQTAVALDDNDINQPE